MEAADYYPQAEATVDIPVSNGEIVSINLQHELPEDPLELVSFLEAESCAAKYWVSISLAYINYRDRLEDAMVIVNKAETVASFTEDDRTRLNGFKCWLYIKYIALGDTQKQQSLDELIQQIRPDIYLQSAYLLLKNNQEEAMRLFDQLLAADDLNCFALLGKAQILLDRKNYAVALKLYQQVLIVNPLIKPDPRIGIGLCFWFLKDYNMAVKSWERSLELNPNNRKAKLLVTLSNFNNTFNNSLTDEDFLANYKKCLQDLDQLDKNDPIILLAIATYYFSKQNYDLVERIIIKIISNINAAGKQEMTNYKLNLLSQCSFWLGRCFFNKGDFNQSQRYFLESLKFDDSNSLSKLGLGLSQVNRSLTQEAILTFEQLLKADTKNLEVNYCLGILHSKLTSRRKQAMAIQFLERYIHLSNNRGLTGSSKDEDQELLQLNKEPIALNAYLVLSKLYESKNISQSLTYLTKAVESRKKINADVPIEVYNNIGVFNFIKGNQANAQTNFKQALENLAPADLDDLGAELAVTLNFNLARSLESTSLDESIKLYEDVLATNPNYFSAKLRLLFLKSVSNASKLEIKEELDNLLDDNVSSLEVRSFYGWFLKTFGKKVGVKPDADTSHQKDTLVKYDSHDCYALISLANIYVIMARDLKGHSNEEKRKKYYVRAIELFVKVLSIDSKNVYAAQGLAIVYIENKEFTKGLDILRKIKDSLDDISVYLNSGHVLVELKQYNKAIESYEAALNRFTDGKDANILNYLSKAWLLRGIQDQNLLFFLKSYDYSKQAIESTDNEKAKNNYKFNSAYIEFQLADFLTKVSVTERKIDELESSLEHLNEAIQTVNTLLEVENAKLLPFAKDDLKMSVNLGNTLISRLTASLEDTKEYNNQIERKLEEARRIREEEEHQKLKAQEEEQLRLKLIEEERMKERVKLQEQAQIWAEENRMVGDDDKLFEEDKEKKEKKGKKRGRKSKKEKEEEKESEKSLESEPEPDLNDSSSDEEANGEPNGDGEAGEAKEAKEAKEANGEGAAEKKRKNVIDDEDDEGDEAPKKRAKQTIDDSDDDLFNE